MEFTHAELGRSANETTVRERAEWLKINAERGLLIDRNIAGTLDDAGKARLAELQDLAAGC